MPCSHWRDGRRLDPDRRALFQSSHTCQLLAHPIRAVSRRGVPNGAPRNRCHATVTALSRKPYIRRTARTTIRTAFTGSLAMQRRSFTKTCIGTALAITPHDALSRTARLHAGKINGKDFVHAETREGDRNASHEKRNTIAASNMSIVATRTYIQWNWSTRSETGFRGLKPGAAAPGFFPGLSQEALTWVSIKAVRRYFA